MRRDTLNQVLVEPPPLERRDEVARQLFPSHVGHRLAWATFAPATDVAILSGLLEARRDDRTVGVVWGRAWPDGVAQVVSPWLARAESDDTADLLLRKLDEHLAACDARVSFAYVPSDDSRSLAWFTGNGYQQVGEMLVMACTADADGKTPADDSLSFHRYEPSCQQQMRDLVKRTHRGSLDFPMLGGIHRGGDVLVRYADAGDSGTEYWRFVRSADRDVGCLLLASHRQHDQCELAYMGLVPDARGNGWGRRIVTHALRVARKIGMRQVVLGVDTGNDPAIAVYASVGFVEKYRRDVLVKYFGSV